MSDLSTLVTSTRIGRIDTGYWRNSEGSVYPDQVGLHLRTHHVESAYSVQLESVPV